MLRIRFSRTGKVGQPSFRIVVAERSAPVKGRYIEIVGNYLPARTPEVVTLDKERISYWIGKGAIPTDTVASLCKKQGFTDMEKFLLPRNRKRSKKGEEAAAAKPAPQGAAAEAQPAEEKAKEEAKTA